MMVGYSTDHAGDCYQMWDPVTGGVHDTRDVTWMHRMFFERQVSLGIVIAPVIIRGIDETPAGSGEGMNDDALNEGTEEGIIVETVLDNEEKDAERESPMEGENTRWFKKKRGVDGNGIHWVILCSELPCWFGCEMGGCW
jgi:hypothetical protein